MAEKVRCPLMKDQEIDLYTCFEIHTVVDGTSPKLIAPSEILIMMILKIYANNVRIID